MAVAPTVVTNPDTQEQTTFTMTTAHGLERSAGRPVSPLRAGRLQPLALQEVTLTRGFWADAQRRNRDRTIPHARHWIEKVGTVGNFRGGAERRGVPFTDSDVYKVLEAMAWELARCGDPAIEEEIESLVAIVAGAVEDDGYLNTYWRARGERYADMQMGHELYCYGHLIQAAVA